MRTARLKIYASWLGPALSAYLDLGCEVVCKRDDRATLTHPDGWSIVIHTPDGVGAEVTFTDTPESVCLQVAEFLRGDGELDVTS